ncbi:MAG TPA: hypothetical protein VEC36_00295 [Patescibacteria group bacterium]|nr:hypothetical protein [Patescibacteria group bacterium]
MKAIVADVYFESEKERNRIDEAVDHLNKLGVSRTKVKRSNFMREASLEKAEKVLKMKPPAIHGQIQMDIPA